MEEKYYRGGLVSKRIDRVRGGLPKNALYAGCSGCNPEAGQTTFALPVQ